jgi:hypothetical protein
MSTPAATVAAITQVHAHALTYLNSQTQEQQDSRQLYHCINSSLTQEAQVAVTLRAQDYTAHR